MIDKELINPSHYYNVIFNALIFCCTFVDMAMNGPLYCIVFRFIWYTNNTANAYKDLNRLVKIHIYHNKKNCKPKRITKGFQKNTNMAPTILHMYSAHCQ